MCCPDIRMCMPAAAPIDCSCLKWLSCFSDALALDCMLQHTPQHSGIFWYEYTGRSSINWHYSRAKDPVLAHAWPIACQTEMTIEAICRVKRQLGRYQLAACSDRGLSSHKPWACCFPNERLTTWAWRVSLPACTRRVAW